MAENCEKISWVFFFIFSDFVFHIMFNFPALFRGQIFVLILKLEVFISFVSCIYFRKLFLIFCCFFPVYGHVRDIAFSHGRGQRNREEIGAEATWFYFSRGFTARSRARFCGLAAQWCSRQNRHAMQANSFSPNWCMLIDCVIH